MSKFTGEQKLRIVLESLLRDVPKKEQCKKYGISEGEFDSWNDKLIKEGGSIFENNPSGKSVSFKSKTKIWKYSLYSSLLVNIALILGGVLWYFFIKPNDPHPYPSDINSFDYPVNDSQSAVSQSLETFSEINPNPDQDARIREQIRVKKENASLNPGQTSPILGLPTVIGDVIPEVDPKNLAREVMLNDKIYEGKHALYVLDASLHSLDSEEGQKSFVDTTNSVINSIESLSSYSFFNLVVFWDLREAAALGKTILRANDENKRFAINWLKSLGSTSESVKENRSQFHPKELLYIQPMPGVVATWYALITAISFEPDLIFIFTGSAAPYQLSSIPYNHLSGLGIDPANMQAVSINSQKTENLENIPDYIGQTAVQWLQSIEKDENLPIDYSKLEQVALERLGIKHNTATLSGMVEIPWRKTFENFLINLDVNFSEIPQTHFFVSMPSHMAWPSELTNSVNEFVESSKGSFTLNRLAP